MSYKKLRLIRQKIGNLTPIVRAGLDKKNRSLLWCQCDCGEYIIILLDNFKREHTKSCGCLDRKQKRTHNKSYIPEYRIWGAMKDRCQNENNPSYKNYGERGIAFCNQWKFFENFINDMGSRPSSKHTIERVNNEKGYSPENCVWATRTINNRNKRIIKRSNTGYVGISWDKDRNKYKVHIGVNCKYVHIGRFKDLSTAIIARRVAELKYWRNF